MQNSTITNCDTGSSRKKTNMISIKNRLKILAASALFLAATNALADIVVLPASGIFIYPENALVTVQDNGSGSIVVRTTELKNELLLKGSDFPPEHEVPASATGKLLISQELELFINLSLGVAEGHASGQVLVNYENGFVIEGNNDPSREIIRLNADVRGTATCLPLNGLDCGQLVVNLELRGALSDPNNPASVGQMRVDMLGSFVWYGSDAGRWAALSANTTIGGNVFFVDSVRTLIDASTDINTGLTPILP